MKLMLKDSDTKPFRHLDNGDLSTFIVPGMEYEVLANNGDDVVVLVGDMPTYVAMECLVEAPEDVVKVKRATKKKDTVESSE